jgi:transcriptional regulator with XRE-family HTH domain
MVALPEDRVAIGRVELGGRLRRLREAKGLRLVEAASRAGISVSYLSDVERGRRLPSLEVLESIAAHLGTTVGGVLRDLYPWDSTSPPDSSAPPRDGRLRPDEG